MALISVIIPCYNQARSLGEAIDLVFLDADYRLLPKALETGLRHLKEHQVCAFVFGRYRLIAFDGTPLPTPPQQRIEQDHYEAWLRKRASLSALEMTLATWKPSVGLTRHSDQACSMPPASTSFGRRGRCTG